MTFAKWFMRMAAAAGVQRPSFRLQFFRGPILRTAPKQQEDTEHLLCLLLAAYDLLPTASHTSTESPRCEVAFWIDYCCCEQAGVSGLHLVKRKPWAFDQGGVFLEARNIIGIGSRSGGKYVEMLPRVPRKPDIHLQFETPSGLPELNPHPLCAKSCDSTGRLLRSRLGPGCFAVVHCGLYQGPDVLGPFLLLWWGWGGCWLD